MFSCMASWGKWARVPSSIMISLFEIKNTFLWVEQTNTLKHNHYYVLSPVQWFTSSAILQILFCWSCKLSFERKPIKRWAWSPLMAVVPLLFPFCYLHIFLCSNRPWNQLTLLPSDYEWRRPLTWRNIWRLFDKHAWQGFLTHDGKQTNLKTLMLLPLPAIITLLQKICVTVSLFIKTNPSYSQLQLFKSNFGHRPLLIDEGGALTLCL